ncbi:MAG: potassium channel family protein [Acidimicrobiia bacterium]|nr:potassium channel family protein [Acidimicrobiia bacterium]
MAASPSDVDLVVLPTRALPPLRAILRRVAAAVGLLVFIGVVVYLGRAGYVDAAGGTIGWLDAFYYASVTVTTTGYGDISAVTPTTRLAALVLITPARILFLILVVGTTVEVLTERSRRLLASQRWRRRVADHHLICGFGSTGQSVASALLDRGIERRHIVVVDVDPAMLAAAAELGLTCIRGDASRVAVLNQAVIDRAETVIVTPNRDDTAVLITLTARELNPRVRIVASVRELENHHLLRQSGADSVIDAAATVGRLLGLATQNPDALDLVHDLLDAGTDLELATVAPTRGEDARWGAPVGVSVVEVVRAGRRLRAGDPPVADLRPDDRLIVVREVAER